MNKLDRKFLVAEKPTLTKAEQRQLESQMDSVLSKWNKRNPGRRFKFGWVKDPALPYWRVEARGVLAENGDEIIRRFWIRKGGYRSYRQVVVGPASWNDPNYTISGVELPEGVDISTWNIDDIIAYVDETFPLPKSRSDVDRINAYQEAYQLFATVKRRQVKTTMHIALLHLYFGWREAWVQLGRDPQDWDTFCDACGLKPKLMYNLLTGKSAKKTYTVDLMIRIFLHFSWYMTRFNGPIVVLNMRPDFVFVPAWVWPDKEMDETTLDVIRSTKIRHRMSDDQGPWVKLPSYRSYWQNRGGGSAHKHFNGEPDLCPETTWDLNLELAEMQGEVAYMRLRPEVLPKSMLQKPTEWEDVSPEDFPRVIRQVMEAGNFDEREFAEAAGTTRSWLKQLLAGKQNLTPKQCYRWFKGLRPYYCPQPEMKTIRRNKIYRWRLVPFDRTSR